MKTTVKLLGFSVVSAAILAGCTGTNLPGGTGADLSKPGFTVTVTKDGQPVGGRKVFLKSYNQTEGSFAGGSDTGITATTDDKGIAVLPVDANALTGLYGVGYDAASVAYGDRAKLAQANNKDEIQFFTTPAIKLSDKPGNRVSVNFDVAWATGNFTPANGSTVQPTDGKITFNLAPKQGATKYEVLIKDGNVAGSGSTVVGDGTVTSTGTTLVWDKARGGNFNYQAKAHVPAGIVGSQMGSSWLVFTVSGAQ